MFRKTHFSIAAFALGFLPVQAAPLTVDVMQTSVNSLYTSISLIEGKNDAILVDAPFTRADAHRVVAWILESGHNLQTIYVTHDHPDHFFSMEVITEAFPNARVVSAPEVVEDIRNSIPAKIKRWGPMLGANGPRHPTAPAPLDGKVLMLEGERVEVIGPMQGDHANSTALYVPSAKTLIAGDLLFNEMHLWLGESLGPQRKAWRAAVERLAGIGALHVIAGHKKPGLPNDTSAIAYTRRYLARFESAVGDSKNSAELRVKIMAAFPATIDWNGDFLLGNSSRVAMGEDPPWME